MTELKKREEVELKDKWDLEKVYESMDAFDKDYQKAEAAIEELKAFEGTLNSVEGIARFMKKKDEINERVSQLFVYTMLKYYEDLGNSDSQTLNQRGIKLMTKFNEATAFVNPEILANSEEDLKNWANSETVGHYQFALERMAALKKHILPKAQEELLASLDEALSSAQQAQQIFTNAEMKFPTVLDEKGEEHVLSHGTYGMLLRSQDRTLRKNAFLKYHETYGNFEATLGHLLTTNMKNWVKEAKIRKYENSVEKALKPNNIPTSVFYNAVDTVNKHLDLLHRYIGIKKKALGLDEFHYYDMYLPLGSAGSEKYTFDEGVDMALKGLKPLGEDYLKNFKEGINNRWIDKYENQGKRSGAYSWGSYSTMPYISLNFDGTLSDVSTMVHEMGHSMHSFYTRANQPFIYGNYSIFLAEVASTTNEKLLIHHLIETTEDRGKRISLIHQELEQIRTTFYRQLMFAEFEKITHEGLESGKSYNAKELDEIWLELNRRYYGEDLVIDDVLKHEWSRIPHFYDDFYVYQYATGYAAASSFAKQILEGGQTVADRYIDKFLKAGSSKYPVDVLKDAGVDMSTPAPLEDTLKTFVELMDRLEKELAEESK